MSSTLIRWSAEEEAALARVQSRLQRETPGRTMTRPDVLRALVLAADKHGIPAAGTLEPERAP